MRLDIDNPEAMLYEYRITLVFRNSLTGATCPASPAPDSKPDWKPEATWISKRRFVIDALPDAEIRRGLFGKLAVVSTVFSGYTSGMSLTGWQYMDLKEICTRAYDQLTKVEYDNRELGRMIHRARQRMVEREKGRGRTEPRPVHHFGTQQIGRGLRTTGAQ